MAINSAYISMMKSCLDEIGRTFGNGIQRARQMAAHLERKNRSIHNSDICCPVHDEFVAYYTTNFAWH